MSGKKIKKSQHSQKFANLRMLLLQYLRIWVKVFKNGPSKIWGRQLLKNNLDSYVRKLSRDTKSTRDIKLIKNKFNICCR